jgi:hypothetical protein
MLTKTTWFCYQFLQSYRPSKIETNQDPPPTTTTKKDRRKLFSVNFLESWLLSTFIISENAQKDMRSQYKQSMLSQKRPSQASL